MHFRFGGEMILGRLWLLPLFCISVTALADGESHSSAGNLRTINVSANALFLYRNSNLAKEDVSTERNGLDIQEAELAFYADVDPYSRLNILLTVHPEYELNTMTNKVEQTYVVAPEELFAETSQLPSTIIKVGKIKAAMGKHNQLHAHGFPLTDAPLVNSVLLGAEGLSDVGISAAVLLPSKWFSEFTVQYLRGEGDNKEFHSETPGDGVGLAHWKNLWDFSDALTMEAGVSYAAGNNSIGGTASLAGADVTFKWRPAVGGKYHSWILAGEYLRRDLEQPGVAAEVGAGFDVWGQYQFAERWSAIARIDRLRIENSSPTVNAANALPNDTTRKYSVGLTFKATEFSSYRAEFNYADGPPAANGQTVERKMYIQANFVIGPHPAHTY